MEVKKQPSMFTISKVDIFPRKNLDENQGLQSSSIIVLKSSSPKHVERHPKALSQATKTMAKGHSITNS